MKKFLFGVLAATALVGCGADNVGACKKWKTAAACGSNTTTLDAINCDSYANTTCDISEYFNCMSTAYVCTNGTYDTAKLANAANCASKAVCK
jgi:hypothetical protein